MRKPTRTKRQSARHCLIVVTTEQPSADAARATVAGLTKHSATRRSGSITTSTDGLCWGPTPRSAFRSLVKLIRRDYRDDPTMLVFAALIERQLEK